VRSENQNLGDDLNDRAPLDELNQTSKSMLSARGKKKKGKKKRLSRAGSKSSRSSYDSDGGAHLKPDYEAEEVISSRRKDPMQLTNKSDLLKPVKEKKKVDDALSKTGDDNLPNDLAKDKDHLETKGFDTLMADDFDDTKKPSQKAEIMKTASTKKVVKRSRAATVRPRRF
jgi:hypothetical protein